MHAWRPETPRTLFIVFTFETFFPYSLAKRKALWLSVGKQVLCDDEFSNSKGNCSTRAVSNIKQLTTVAMFSIVIKKVNKVVFLSSKNVAMKNWGWVGIDQVF